MKEETGYKIKLVLITAGVTIAAYLIIKFMLPLVTPFIFAGIISLILIRPIDFLCNKTGMNRSFATVLMMIAAFAVLSVLVFFVVKTVTNQFRELLAYISQYFEGMSSCFRNFFCRMDRILGLNLGTCEEYVKSRVDIKGGGGVIGSIGLFFTATAFAVMAVFFICKDYHKIRDKLYKSILGSEIRYIVDRSRKVFGVYLRTQSIIMCITALICVVGLWIMGNKYALFLGITIGIMDALPVLGTGTFFVPWIIVLLINSSYSQALGIGAIYLLCYYVRQFLEPKLMSDRLSISPLLMLMALYVGLILFGISGVITGPVATIFIKEIVQMCKIRMLGKSTNT